MFIWNNEVQINYHKEVVGKIKEKRTKEEQFEIS